MVAVEAVEFVQAVRRIRQDSRAAIVGKGLPDERRHLGRNSVRRKRPLELLPLQAGPGRSPFPLPTVEAAIEEDDGRYDQRE